MRVRLVTRLLAASLAAACALLLNVLPARAYSQGPSCGEQMFSSDKGVFIKVLFANNGFVQRYLPVGKQQNLEYANDLRLHLESKFGPAGANTPPLRILSFKNEGGGLQVPDKAVDSCGRTLSFQ